MKERDVERQYRITTKFDDQILKWMESNQLTCNMNIYTIIIIHINT